MTDAMVVMEAAAVAVALATLTLEVILALTAMGMALVLGMAVSLTLALAAAAAAVATAATRAVAEKIAVVMIAAGVMSGDSGDSVTGCGSCSGNGNIIDKVIGSGSDRSGHING